MKKIKQAFGGIKKDKDSVSVSSRLSESAETGYETKGDLPKLHFAAWNGNLQKVKSLLSSGKCDIDELDGEQRTALHLACARGHAEICKELLQQNAKYNVEDKAKKTALMKAIDCQQVGCVQQLLTIKSILNAVDKAGETALHQSVKTGNPDVVRAVINAGAKLDVKNREGFSPLLLAVTLKYEEVLEALLEKGANVNATTPNGRTPLMIACEQNAPSTVSLLLRYKANISAEDPKGQTAEDIAFMIGHHDCAELIEKSRTARRSSTSGPSSGGVPAAASDEHVSGKSSLVATPVQTSKNNKNGKKDDTKSISSAGSLRKKSETPKMEKKNASQQQPPPRPVPPSVPSTPSQSAAKVQDDDDDWSDSESLSIGVKKPAPRRNITVPRVSSVEEVPLDPPAPANKSLKPTDSPQSRSQQQSQSQNDKQAKKKKKKEEEENDFDDSDSSEDEVKEKPKAAAAKSGKKADDDGSDWDSTENDVSSLQNSPRKQPANAASLVVLPEEETATVRPFERQTSATADTASMSGRKPPIAASPKAPKANAAFRDLADSDTDFDDDFEPADEKPKRTGSLVRDSPVSKKSSDTALAADQAQAAISNALTQQISTLQETLAIVKSQLEQENAKNRELTAKVESLQQGNNATLREMEELSRAKSTLGNEHQQMKDECRKMETELREERERRKAAEQDFGRMKALVDEKQAEIDRGRKPSQADGELAKLKSEQDEIRRKMAAVESERDDLKKKLEQAAGDNNLLQTSLRDAETRLRRTEEALRKAEAEAESARNAVPAAPAPASQDGANVNAVKAALQAQIDQLEARRLQEIAQKQVENEVLNAQIQQLGKEAGVLKGSLNEANLLLEQEREAKIRAIARADAATAAAAAAELRQPSVNMQAQVLAIAERDSKIRELQDVISTERQHREELLAKVAESNDKLQRVDGFVKQIFVSLKRHYRPDNAVQPLVDEINALVDVYNRQLSLPQDFIVPKLSQAQQRVPTLTPTGSGSGSRLEDAVVVRHDSRLRTTAQKPPIADSCNHSHSHPHSKLDAATALRLSLGLDQSADSLVQVVPWAPTSPELTNTSVAESFSPVQTGDFVEKIAVGLNSSLGSTNRTARAREEAARALAEQERLNALASFKSSEPSRLLLQRSLSPNNSAELKIERLVKAVDRIQTDLSATTASLDDLSRRPYTRERERERESPDSTVRSRSTSFRSSSLPGGPTGIIPATASAHNRSASNLAESSDESFESDSAEPVTKEDVASACRVQNAALQNVKLQLAQVLESMRREPEQAAALAESVSESVMPLVDSISQQIAARPVRARRKSKRRVQRKKMLDQIGEMLHSQASSLNQQIEQLRVDAERKFVDRDQLEFSGPATVAKKRIDGDDELNDYIEQRTRAKKELDRKRLECSIAAEQMHLDAKRELDNRMRQLREALSNVTNGNQPESEVEYVPNDFAGRDGSLRGNFAPRAAFSPSSTARPPLPVPSRPNSSLSASLSSTVNSSHNLRVDALNSTKTSHSSGFYSPSPSATLVNSSTLNWNEIMPPSLRAYRDYVYNKRLV